MKQMGFMQASVLVPEFLLMPIKSPPGSQSANIHWTMLYVWLVGEYKTGIAISWWSLPWNVFLPPLLSFLFLPQEKIKLLPRFPSPLGLQKDVEGPSVHTRLMSNFIDHVPHFNRGLIVKDWCFCLNTFWFLFHFSGFAFPVVVA